MLQYYKVILLEIKGKEKCTYNKFDWSAGTFRRSNVKIVTSPKAVEANNSGTAVSRKPPCYAKQHTPLSHHNGITPCHLIIQNICICYMLK